MTWFEKWFVQTDPEPPAPPPRPHLEVYPDNVNDRKYQHPDYDEILIKRAWLYVIFPDWNGPIQDAIWSEDEHPGGFASRLDAQREGRSRVEQLLRDR